MPEDLDVLVVGGGLAGIAAALELQHQGRKVLLVERSAALGGKAGSVDSAAGVFPTGPTSFNGRVPSFWRLLALLGLTEEAVPLSPASSARFVVRGGKLRGLRPHPLSVLSTSALTWGEKWALAREYLRPAPPRAEEGDEPLEALLVRRFGEPVVKHFFAAVLNGVFAGNLAELSAQTCMPSLSTAEKEYGSVLKGALSALKVKAPGARPGLYGFRRGFGVLGERAAQRLPCSLETEVERLRFDARGVVLQATQRGRPLELRAASLVLATEAGVAARLLLREAPEASALLAALRYAPLALVQWSEATPGDSWLPNGFGYLAAPVEGLFGLGTLFVADLLGEAPRRFSTFIGGALQPARAALTDDTLIDGVRADLQRLTGGVVGQVHRVVRWPGAVFQPAVGHAAHVARLHRSLAGQPVVLAGSYLGGAAMKDALASGFAAAAAFHQPAAPRLAELVS